MGYGMFYSRYDEAEDERDAASSPVMHGPETLEEFLDDVYVQDRNQPLTFEEFVEEMQCVFNKRYDDLSSRHVEMIESVKRSFEAEKSKDKIIKSLEKKQKRDRETLVRRVMKACTQFYPETDQDEEAYLFD